MKIVFNNIRSWMDRHQENVILYEGGLHGVLSGVSLLFIAPM